MMRIYFIFNLILISCGTSVSDNRQGNSENRNNDNKPIENQEIPQTPKGNQDEGFNVASNLLVYGRVSNLGAVGLYNHACFEALKGPGTCHPNEKGWLFEGCYYPGGTWQTYRWTYCY